MSYRDLSPQAFEALTRAHFRRVTLSRRQALIGAGAALGAFGLPNLALAQPTPGGVLRVGRADEPDLLDPHNTSLAVSSMTMDLIFEPLARRDVDANIIPGLAESWEFTNENKTLVFNLKPGALFHDGTPMDAEAVAWTAMRHIDPDRASQSRHFLGPLERVEVIDATTVAYHYTDPFVPVWVGLTLGYCAPMPRGPVEELGDRFGRQPVGGGPFRFVSWSPDRGIRLERNAEYGPVGPPPALDAVEFLHYPEDSTRLAAFDTGEINAIFFASSVPIDAVRRLRNDPDANLMQRPAQMMRALTFNQSRAPFDNPRVRQAIAHAVDPEAVVAFALDGNAQVATSMLASQIPGHDPEAGPTHGQAYDPARAREILAEEGLGDGFTCSMICDDVAVIRRTAEVIQAQLAEVGVTLTIDSMPLAQRVAVSAQGEHDMLIATYSFSEADIVFVALHSTGALNRMFVDDPWLDEMTARQRVTADPEARQQMLDEIQAHVLREAYWKPLFEPLNFALAAPEVGNAELSAGGILIVQDLYLQS